MTRAAGAGAQLTSSRSACLDPCCFNEHLQTFAAAKSSFGLDQHQISCVRA